MHLLPCGSRRLPRKHRERREELRLEDEGTFWGSAVPCPPSCAGTSKEHSREGGEEVKWRGAEGSVYVTNLLPVPGYSCATGVGKTSRALGRNTQILTSPGKTHPAGLQPPRSRSQLWCCTGADCEHHAAAATGHVLQGVQ